MLEKAIFILAGCVAVAIAATLFNWHCDKRFKYRFFSKKMFFLLGFALCLWMAGTTIRIKGGQPDDDLPGYILIGASVVVFWWILVLNFTRTNLVYGFFGSIAQIAVFSTLSYAGIFSAILAVGIGLALVSLFEPVYVMNRRKDFKCG